MGWEEGKGLGKNEDGITAALKPRLKQDACGLGYDKTNEYSTHVWFANIDEVIQTAKNKSTGKRKSEGKEKFYDKFVKSDSLQSNKHSDDAELSDDTQTNIGVRINTATVEEQPKKKKRKTGEINLDRVYKLTGTTCHKGSRHAGGSMSAKQLRLAEQEELFLKSMIKN